MANDLLAQLICEKDADLLIISEEYQNRDSQTWFSDTLGTAAIWVSNPRKVMVDSHGSGNGFVWIRSNETMYISCYLTPNEGIQEFQTKLDSLEEVIQEAQGRVLVAGDFNAKAVEWGMPKTDSRGRRTLEMAARLGLIVLNSGRTSTFRRPGYTETIPDITFATETLTSLIEGWKVIEDFTGSDHQ